MEAQGTAENKPNKRKNESALFPYRGKIKDKKRARGKLDAIFKGDAGKLAFSRFDSAVIFPGLGKSAGKARAIFDVGKRRIMRFFALASLCGKFLSRSRFIGGNLLADMLRSD